ncbi:COG4223 family protein [Oceanomicrobium pacificus]|uniref:Inner membrane protein n=1 Tax=Oceanomicrobium pacificus TaxID=2692916 RepID=A0A6B0TK30_9RHOB|nr:hypothetical protein [Oceanomicrobium pacificus]MXU64807.1 hypothetical protein [Oceanomicrobium pacificus]
MARTPKTPEEATDPDALKDPKDSKSTPDTAADATDGEAVTDTSDAGSDAPAEKAPKPARKKPASSRSKSSTGRKKVPAPADPFAQGENGASDAASTDTPDTEPLTDAVEAPAEEAAPAEAELADIPAETPSEAPDLAATAYAEEHHAADAALEAEEDHSTSLAARALQIIALLFIGALIALWAAPKIAQNLPAGMAPVAEWLAPGQAELAERLEAENAALAARIAALEEAPAPETGTPAEVETLRAELDQLRDALQSSGAGDLESRIAAAESRIDGLVGAFGSLEQQLTDAAASEGGTINSAQLAAMAANVDGLKAEIETLLSRNEDLNRRIGEIAATASDRAEAAEESAAQASQSAEIRTGLAAVSAAITTGQPFASDLSRLEEALGTDAPDDLTSVADSGVATMPALRASFGGAAHDAIRASIRAGSGDGAASKLGAFLKAQMASRSLEPQSGLTPDAILSRMEDDLRQDNLAAALDEADDLPSEAQAAMQGWLDRARARQAAVAALAELERSAALN